YDEYGHVLLDTAPGFQPFGFGGGLYDPKTGLVHFGARDLDPETGRFTSKDPLLLAAGTNVYAYADDDPVNHTDPSGLSPAEDASNTGAGIGDPAFRFMSPLNPGPAIRRWLGVDDLVDPCSMSYKISGTATDVALAVVGGFADAEAAAEVEAEIEA